MTREEVVRTIGHPMDQAMDMLWGRYDPAWMIYYREQLVPLEYERIIPFPGTREVLSNLREGGLSLGVVSNRKRLVLAVERAGLKEYFLSVIGMEDVKNPKPHPESILLSLEDLGSVAGEAILVGDSEIDALAARRAGVGFIGLATGGTSREVLWGGGALAVIDGISELLQVLPGYINRLYREPESDMIKI